MKISKQTVNDLLVLVSHTRSDLSYLEGGTYTKEESPNDPNYVFDEKDAKAAERAIEFIKQIIILS